MNTPYFKEIHDYVLDDYRTKEQKIIDRYKKRKEIKKLAKNLNRVI